MGKGKHRARDTQRKVVTSAIGTGVALSMTFTLAGAGLAKAETVRTVPAAGSSRSEVAQPAQWPAAEPPNVHPYEGLEIPHDTLSSLQWARPMPEKDYLAPVGVLHPPVPVAPVPPIAPPAGKLRFGDVQVDAPQWLYREQAIQVNDGAAVAEADMATFLDSVGMERSRSDRIAGETLGGAAIGAAAGAAVASPFALIGAVVGGGIGLAVGVPFAPIGLAAGPIGAAYGAALMAVPLTAIGAAAGGTLGAVHALTAPPRTVEDR